MSAGNAAKPAHTVAAEFLSARNWVVSEIAGSVTPPAGTSEKAIEELLVYERCAAWLLASMTSSGSIGKVSPGIAEVIRKAAAKETQSAISARVEGRELSKVAARLGIQIVVLKGGVRAITGDSPALPIVDIDILVRPEDVNTVVEELERSEFGKALPALTHHRGIDPAPGRLSIEVHWTTFRDGRPLDPSLWNRIEPITNTPGLYALSNVDQLLHVVRHALLNHRQRPVTIRDTLLAGIAARRCSEDELSRVGLELESDRNQREAVEMIAFGQRLIAAEGDAADPFIDKCATFYSAVAVARRLPRSITSSAALAFVTEIALGRVGLMYAIRNSLQWRGTDVNELNTLGQKFPGVARPLIGLAHMGYYSLFAAVALPMIYRTRSKALREIGQRKP